MIWPTWVQNLKTIASTITSISIKKKTQNIKRLIWGY